MSDLIPGVTGKHEDSQAMTESRELNAMVGRLRMRHFEFLDHLGRDPNLCRVAGQMNMAQSTATKMLHEIEEIVGSTLFLRNRRGIAPTAVGDALVKRAGLILSDLRAGYEEVLVVRSGGAGRVRLGVFPVATAHLLPSIYQRLGREFPGMRLVIEEGDEARLSVRLSEGKIDAILGRIVAERMTPDLRHKVLYHEATVVVCRASHPAAGATGAALLAHLAAAHWILPKAGSGAFRLVASLLAGAGHSAPKVAVETISVLVTGYMLANTDMLAVMPRSVADDPQRLGTLAILPVSLSSTEFPVGVIYRKEVEDSFLIRTIVAQAVHAARSFADATTADLGPAA